MELKPLKEQVADRTAEIKRLYGDHPQCYLFAVLMCTYFDAVIYYDHNHCVVQIGDWFFDRNGEYPVEEVIKKNFLPLQNYGMDIEKTLMDALIETKGNGTRNV
jgi:hypothetical protein